MRPVIGITGNQTQISDSKYQAFPVNYSPLGYTDAVTKAGGTPVIIPVGVVECVEHYVSLIDALLLTGGQDVSPALYGEEPHVLMESTSPERDAVELALIEAAMKQGKPILGVCRGLQILNVYFGGSMYQDVSIQPAIKIQHVQKSQPHAPTHSVSVTPGTHLANLIDDGSFVNSIHHQAVNRVGEGLMVSAYSQDGVIEALESQENNQILAVQWHPEELVKRNDTNLSIFEDLIERAKLAKQE